MSRSENSVSPVTLLRTFCLLSLGLALVAQSGCKRESPPPPPESAPELEDTAEADSAAVDSRGRSTKWYTKDEVYGDREMFKEPRIQFSGAAPGEKRDSIWSMKLDGSDVRRTVGPELLYSGEAKRLFLQPPVRSPDGRYVACVGEDAKGDQLRFLVDLKEKKVRTITKGYGAAIFNWTPDSKDLLFYSNLDFWQYSPENGQLKQLPMIYTKELLLIDGGRRFVSLRSNAVEYYDRSGKKLQRIMLPFEIGEFNAVSPDGRVLAVTVNAKRIVVKVDKLKEPLHEDDRFYVSSVFSADSKRHYYFSAGQLKVLDLVSSTVAEIGSLPKLAPYGATIVDLRGMQ